MRRRPAKSRGGIACARDDLIAVAGAALVSQGQTLDSPVFSQCRIECLTPLHVLGFPRPHALHAAPVTAPTPASGTLLLADATLADRRGGVTRTFPKNAVLIHDGDVGDSLTSSCPGA